MNPEPRKFDRNVIEPYCYECSFDMWTGDTYCNCGWSREERKDSGWKLNGTCPNTLYSKAKPQPHQHKE